MLLSLVTLFLTWVARNEVTFVGITCYCLTSSGRFNILCTYLQGSFFLVKTYYYKYLILGKSRYIKHCILYEK